MISGQVHVMFDAMPTALPQVKANRLRPVAVTTAKRSLQMPELPTVAEAGLPGYEAAGWFGYAAPARTPRDIIGKLNTEIVRILKLPDVPQEAYRAGRGTRRRQSRRVCQVHSIGSRKVGQSDQALDLKIE